MGDKMEQTPYYPMGQQPDTGATDADWCECIGLMLENGDIGVLDAIRLLPAVRAVVGVPGEGW